MTDDGGVLGNLPNSRPGKRSEKRDSGPKRTPRKRATAVKTARSGDGVGVSSVTRAQRMHDPVPPPASEDPVGAVVRTGTSIAVAGVKVAGAVTREVFRRLPRP